VYNTMAVTCYMVYICSPLGLVLYKPYGTDCQAIIIYNMTLSLHYQCGAIYLLKKFIVEKKGEKMDTVANYTTDSPTETGVNELL